MQVLNEVSAPNKTFSFLDGGILQVRWVDNGGNIGYTHYRQFASDETDWREGPPILD